MRNRSGGFCVFNDVAVAAGVFLSAGWRVGTFDLDAHHGDGVEELLLLQSEALTASVHEDGIFPGTGRQSRPEVHAYNWPLAGESGDDVWLEAVRAGVARLEWWRPDILIFTIGADAHESDPLSTLRVSADGYDEAGELVGDLVRRLDVPVLMCGAGGYQPLTWTPRLWASVVTRVVCG
jgi:acetoin utilization protein AcuC